MSRRTLTMTDELYDYLLEASVREDDLLRRLRVETSELAEAGMQISPEQGQFMQLLCELIGARQVLELGTFTGYSSICLARSLPREGRLVCCDVSEAWTRIAQRYWVEAGLESRIQLRLGPALQTLDAMLQDGEAGAFDFVFVDADKRAYDAYYDRCFELVRAGGVIAFDNMLWGGSVARPGEIGSSTEAIRALNARLRDDDRISLSLVPIGDGLALARKR